MGRDPLHTSTSTHIGRITYFNRSHPELGIEAVSLRTLLTRVPTGHFDAPQRPEFHLLLLCQAGHSTHAVDFLPYEWSPWTLLHVRPGQVQQFNLRAGMKAQILLFTPAFLTGQSADPLLDRYLRLRGPVRFPLDLRRRQHWRTHNDFMALVDEYRYFDASEQTVQVLRYRLHTLLLQIMRLSANAVARTREPGAMRRAYDRFEEEVERRFRQTRRVEDYAEALGYSPKTLGRACQYIAGIAPKKLVERRVALEAKRLLAHTHGTVQAIAHELGYSEETNFVKFFKRHEGMSPTAFRGKHSAP